MAQELISNPTHSSEWPLVLYKELIEAKNLGNDKKPDTGPQSNVSVVAFI